jgi:hypothetical protein
MSCPVLTPSHLSSLAPRLLSCPLFPALSLLSPHDLTWYHPSLYLSPFPVLLGRGKDQRTVQAVSESPRGSFSSNRRDYIASDMFTVVADTEAKRAVVCGFLGEIQDLLDLLCYPVQCTAMRSLFGPLLFPSVPYQLVI